MAAVPLAEPAPPWRLDAGMAWLFARPSWARLAWAEAPSQAAALPFARV